MKVTAFQQKVLDCVAAHSAASVGATTWEIAQEAFPEKWKNRASRGALIGHIDNAGVALKLTRRAPQDKNRDATFWMPNTFQPTPSFRG